MHPASQHSAVGRGSFQAYWVRERILGATWWGPVDAQVVKESYLTLRRFAGDTQITAVLVDTTNMQLKGDIHRPAQDVVQLFRARGVMEVVAVMPSSLVRLVAATAGMAIRLNIRSFADIDKAKQYLDEKYPYG